MSLIGNVVAIADKVTKSLRLQSEVTWEAWIGQSGRGRRAYADPVTLNAIVDLTRKQRPTASGKMATIIATVTILEAITPNEATTVPARVHPIDPHDRITLPDGTSGPIFAGPGSVYDPDASAPFVNEILISEVATQP